MPIYTRLPEHFSTALPPPTWVYCLRPRCWELAPTALIQKGSGWWALFLLLVLLIGFGWQHAGLSKSRYLSISPVSHPQTRLLRESVFTLEAVLWHSGLLLYPSPFSLLVDPQGKLVHLLVCHKAQWNTNKGLQQRK